jgi:hypothetical protein
LPARLAWQNRALLFTSSPARLHTAMKRVSEGEKISLAECRRILNTEGNKYTDDEIKLIRDWLYQFAENVFAFVQNKSKEEVQLLKELLKNKKQV